MFRRRDCRVSGFPLRGSVPHAVFRFHLPLVELDVRISRIQLSDGIRGRGPRHSHWPRMSSPSLWLVPRRPGLLVEVIGNMATLQTLAVSRSLPNSGPFPPPALPGFQGTMSLSDSPRGPARRLTPVPRGRPVGFRALQHASTAWGLPCCGDLLAQTCRRHYPGGIAGGFVARR